MLTLEQCQALKAAGFPQYDTDKYPSTVLRHVGDIARPNSDELLADIQQRWPEYDHLQFEDILSNHIVVYDPDTEGHYPDVLVAKSPSLLAALCALYLKLAEQAE